MRHRCGDLPSQPRDAVRCCKACLLENGVEEHLEFSQVIRAWDKDQVVFILRDSYPSAMREALHFLLGCAVPRLPHCGLRIKK